MFQPNQSDVRRFFCAAHAAQRAGLPLDPMAAIAARWIAEHPEYHDELADEAAALQAVYTVEEGRTNPFLHLSMHLALEEQLSIDQPPGIRDAVRQLEIRLGSAQDARHAVMDCLAEVVWQAQRNAASFDNATYLDCLARKAQK